MPLPGSSLLSSLSRRLLRLLPARPPLRGRRSVPGLRGEVRIDYTEGGLPHLSASSNRDLFFAQGYLTATERLFQMDLARRSARGELAEIFGARPAPWRDLSVLFRGASLVEVDLFLRQLALGAVAKASVEALDLEQRVLVEDYARGVNAAIEEGLRPLECQLLGYRPRPWTAVDSALIWKGLAFQRSYGWRAGLAAEALRARFPDDSKKARALLPEQRDVADVLLPAFPGAADGLHRLQILGGGGAPGGGGLGGSNAWAIAGSRSHSGRALLCGDPHLPLHAPATGYVVHLQGGEYDVAGWSIPGLPGVVMGHNDRIAWSLTSGCTLDATWAMEQLSADGEQVRTAKGFEPLTVETAEILVRGEQAPIRKHLRFSANGPLFESALLGESPPGFALALRWTGHLPTRDLEAILALDRARDFPSMQAAAALVGAPSLNVVYADVDGRVGWQLAGLAPRFHGRPPLGAVPGWASEHEWDGLEPFEKLPSLSSPPDGLVVSANQKLVPSGAAVQLGELFEPPWRARRIRSRLEKLEKPTLAEAAAIQGDLFSGFGAELRDRFLRPFADRLAERTRPSGAAADLLSLACAWTAFAEPDSAGAAAAWSFAMELARDVFEAPLGERLFHAIFEQHNLPLRPLLRVLEARGAPFHAPEALDEIALKSLASAAARLVARCGRDPARWRLGALRTVTLRHPLGALPGLGRLFALGPFAGGGDGSTVNAATFRLDGDGATEEGPVFRHAVECGDWDHYGVAMAGGAGGDPTTWRYRELLDRWRRGELVTFPFSTDAIRKASRTSAELAPEKPA